MQQVSIDVIVNDGDPSAVHSLLRWLLRDRDLRRDASVSLATRGSSGEMSALEVINVLVAQGTGLLNLALAFAAWRDARSTPATITVTVNQQSITLVNEAGEDMQRKLRVLLMDRDADDNSAEDDDYVSDNGA